MRKHPPRPQPRLKSNSRVRRRARRSAERKRLAQSDNQTLKPGDQVDYRTHLAIPEVAPFSGVGSLRDPSQAEMLESSPECEIKSHLEIKGNTLVTKAPRGKWEEDFPPLLLLTRYPIGIPRTNLLVWRGNHALHQLREAQFMLLHAIRLAISAKQRFPKGMLSIPWAHFGTAKQHPIWVKALKSGQINPKDFLNPNYRPPSKVSRKAGTALRRRRRI